MIEHVERRFLALFLAVVMVFLMLPIGASAAEVTLLDGKITVSAESAEASGNNVTATASATSSTDNCGTTTWSAGTNTITVKNTSGGEAIVKFVYTATGAASFTINEAPVANSGTYSATLGNDGYVSLVITSGAAEGNTATLSLTGFEVISNESRTLTFPKVISGGTATAGGVELSTLTTESHSVIATFNDGVAVTATQASGYTFVAWVDANNNILSTTANTTLQPTADATVRPLFVANSSTQAYWQTSGKLYTDLNDASTDAKAGDGTVVLLRNATLPEGDYKIHEGVTLLIPFDAAHTLYTTTPEYVSGYTKPTAFRTLTMASGANLVVEGALSVSAKHATVQANVYGGAAPTVAYGHIKMNSGSSIYVSGALYAWGYISGDGVVTAENNAVVYENMQFADFRGGTAMVSMMDKTVFPLSQYYVQNIETKLVLKPGATEYALTTVEASGTTASTAVEFISPSNGMFVTGDNTTVTKDYNPATDMLEITVDGDLNIKSLTLTVTAPIVGEVTVNSGTFVLPINSNINIELLSGTTTVNQDISLLPGTKLTVGKNATLNISKDFEVYVYDRDEYVGKGYVYNNGAKDLIAAQYSPTSGRKVRTSADLVDAVIDVNGVVTVYGSLYTTESGAQIVSSEGTGMIVYGADAGTATTVAQVTQSDRTVTETTVAITSAQLLNGDGGFTETAGTKAASGFAYDAESDKWVSADAVVTFDPNGGQGNAYSQTVSIGNILMGQGNSATIPDAATLGFSNDTEFTGWNTAADGSGTAYAAGQTLTVTETITLYAQWEKTYTATFYVNDGTGWKQVGDPITFKEGDKISAPEFSYDDSYEFSGWNVPDVMPAGDARFEATLTKKVYTITWVDGDGNELYYEDVEAGTVPVYKGDTPPTKTSDAEYTYEFAGWSPEVVAVTGDATYTAQFTGTKQSYEITWVVEGEEPFAQDYEYGKTPDYPKNEPSKDGYNFLGWATAENGTVLSTLPDVTSDATYYAVFAIKTYTVTWVADGVTVDTETVEHGKDATKTPAVPAKVGHTGSWSGTATNVTENVTITATYTKNKYTVTFLDGYDGGTIWAEELEYGTEIVYPEDPSRTGHTFTGWDKEIDTVPAEDVTITATWEINKYKVTWANWNGEVLEIDENVLYGTEPSFDGETPSRENTAAEIFEFAGWENLPEEVVADVIIKASFKSTVATYTITWVDEDGTVLEEDKNVPYGEAPKYDGATPTKDDTAEFDYVFAGWTPELATVTGDATYTATYSSTKNSYAVTWENEDGTVLETDTNVPYGTTPNYGGETPTKAATAEYTYTFAGWSPTVDKVTGNVTYTATYTSKVNKYTIKFVDEDGNVISEIEVAYGKMPTAPDDPTKAATAEYTYTFAGWTPTVDTVTCNATYTATFTETPNEYTVTWVVDGFETAETYAYGATINMISDPTKEGYTFAGWDDYTEGMTMPAKDVTFTATWTIATNTLIVYGMESDKPLYEQDVAYGTQLTGEGGLLSKITVSNVYVENGVHKFAGSWLSNLMDETTGEMESAPATMPDYQVVLHAVYSYTGWEACYDIATGVIKYFYINGEAGTQKSGWTLISEAEYIENGTGSAWYYLDTETGYRAEGAARVPYPTEAIDGVRYAADANDAANGDKYGYTDETTSVFVFDENGKFQSTKNGMIEVNGVKHWAVNGQLPWHVGMVKDGDSYYYFIGDADGMGNELATGDIYVSRNTTEREFADGGVYTFAEDGKLCEYNGITDVNGVLRYYENAQLMLGKGLVKVDENYYYVNSKGALIVDRTYWVANVNECTDIPVGTYTFDANGVMSVAHLAKNGVIAEDGELYYYENGYRTYKGLMAYNGGYIYVRTGGKLATGRYWITRVNDTGYAQGYYEFDENGMMQIQKNGVVDGYYYVNGEIAYNAGLIAYNNGYIYVRSNGQVVAGRTYWCTNSNGFKAAYYEFDANGMMVGTPEAKPETTLNGVVDGYYYKNGAIAYGAGAVKLEDGSYIYVRSNGQLATGKYWVTTDNGILENKSYDFGEDGYLVIE